MIKTFTQIDLIRYIYLETSTKETREIDRALLGDAGLKAMYDELCLLKKELDGVQLEPSGTTVLNILSYARTMQPKNAE